VYDMYPWDEGSAASGTDTASTDTASAGTARFGALARLPRPRPEPGISAVQVALDRRDNGGDPAAAPGTSPSSPARQ
jgi:hypothetical protein